jgi:hypothetical protein
MEIFVFMVVMGKKNLDQLKVLLILEQKDK